MILTVSHRLVPIGNGYIIGIEGTQVSVGLLLAS